MGSQVQGDGAVRFSGADGSGCGDEPPASDILQGDTALSSPGETSLTATTGKDVNEIMSASSGEGTGIGVLNGTHADVEHGAESTAGKERQDNECQPDSCLVEHKPGPADENTEKLIIGNQGSLQGMENKDILTLRKKADSSGEEDAAAAVTNDDDDEVFDGNKSVLQSDHDQLPPNLKESSKPSTGTLNSEENGSGSQGSSADGAVSPGEGTNKNGYISLRPRTQADENDSDVENSMSRLPIDSGWAWMIVLSCCVMHILSIGSAKSFGVVFVEFLDKFHTSSGETAWMMSLNAFLAMALGPFATSMGVRFGNRIVVFLGGLLYGIGYLLSGFAPTLLYLYFSYGVIAGIGISLVYAPSVVMVAQYFEKRRALANGISVAGSGIGNFIFPPLIRYLIINFSLQGALLILGGLFFNLCVCGVLLRPTEFYTKARKKDGVCAKEQGKGLESQNDAVSDLREITGSKGPVNKFIDRVKTDGFSSGESKPHRSKEGNELDPLIPKQSSQKTIPTISIQAESSSSLPLDSYSSCSLPKIAQTVKVSLENMESPGASELAEADKNARVSVGESVSLQDIHMHHSRKQIDLNRLVHKRPKHGHQSLQDVRPPKWVVPCEEDAILPRFTVNSPTIDSLEDAHGHFSHLNKPRTLAMGTSLGDLVFMSIQSIPAQLKEDEQRASHDHALDNVTHIVSKDQAETKVSCGRRLYEKLFFMPGKEGVKKRPLFDWTLLKNPIYFMYGASVFFATCGYPCIFIIIPANTREIGLTKDDGAMLVSIIGIADLIGRVFFGWFSDLNLLPKRYGFLSAMIFAGICCLVLPFVTTFTPTAIVCAIFGLFGGSYTALIAVILVESLGVAQLPSAFGLSVLGQGIALFISMPLVGWLRDYTGNWHAAFFYAGLMLITGGAVVLFEPCAQRCLENQEEDDLSESPALELEVTAQV